MLSIMVKLSVISWRGCVNTWVGISALTEKRVKRDDDSAIKEHLLFCSHAPGFEDFSIFAINNNDFKVMLMKSLLIHRDQPPLNKNKQSLPKFHHMIDKL